MNTTSSSNTVEVYDNGNWMGSAIIEGNQWSLQVSALGYGAHTLTAKSGTLTSNTWQLTVNEPVPPLEIDSSDLLLNGRMIRFGRTPTHPPAGCSATRTAKGGNPPYTYSASGNAVNCDPNTGQVIAWRNTTSIVTVRDSKGATATYRVITSNVLEIDGYMGNNIYRVCTASAADYGGRIPTLAEWQDFRNTYGGSPQLPESQANPQAWSTTSAGGNLYRTISPNTGATGTQPDQSFIGGGKGAANGWAIVARNA